MTTAQWVPIANLSAQFLDDECEPLKDLLSTYLRTHDLGRLTTVCKSFRTWADARRPKLVIDEHWKPYGYMGEDATMAVNRTIRTNLRMRTVYVNEDGNVLTTDVPPSNAVDSERTCLQADLVCHNTRRVRQRIYSQPFWRQNCGFGADPSAWPDPQTARFQIPRLASCLSNLQMPPSKYFVRFTLEVYNHNGHELPTSYTHDTPEFWSVDARTIPKRKSDEAAKLNPPKRRRRWGAGPGAGM